MGLQRFGARRRIEDITAEVESRPQSTRAPAPAPARLRRDLAQLLPGQVTACSTIAQIAKERVDAVADFVKEGQIVRVKVIEADEKGRLRLSMKAVTPEEREMPQ